MSHIQVVQEIGMTGMLRTGIGGRFIQYFAIDTIEGSRLTQAKLSSCTRAKQCFADPRSSLIYREVCSDSGSVNQQNQKRSLNPLSTGKS
ncbi:hypothetical protein, partial [Acinetobacter parvus]